MYSLISLSLFVGFASAGISGEADQVIPLPLDRYEYISEVPQGQQYVENAGIIRFRLEDVFYDVNSGQTTGGDQIVKPNFQQIAYGLNGGENCQRGFTSHYWAMTKKDAKDIPGTNPTSAYFVQKLNDWYSNTPEILYGFFNFDCDVRNATAEVLIGGELVRLIHAGRDIPLSELLPPEQ